MLQVAIGLAVLLVVMVGGRWLWLRFRPARQLAAERRGGTLVLRPPRLLNAALGVTFLPVPLVMASLEWRLAGRAEVGPVGILVVSAMVAVGVGATLWLVAAEFRHRYEVTEFAIERFGVVTRRRIAWSGVAKIVYNPLRRWFFMKGTDGTHLWISEDLRGIGDFAAIALQRLPGQVLDAEPHTREALEEIAAEAAAA